MRKRTVKRAIVRELKKMAGKAGPGFDTDCTDCGFKYSRVIFRSCPKCFVKNMETND